MVLVSPYPQSSDHVLAAPSDSGLNWYTKKLAAALSVAGVDVSVVGPRLRHGNPRPWNDGAVKVFPSYVRGSLRAPWEIVRGALACGSRIVHVQHELFAYGGLATAFILPMMMRQLHRRGRAVVTTIHGVLPLEKIDRAFVRANGIPAPPAVARQLWRGLLRRVAAASDIIHVHEPALALRLRAQYGVVDRPVEVIPLGIDPWSEGTQERVRARRALQLPEDAEVVLFFGYLAGYKGIRHLIDDIPSLLQRRPRMRVLIAGSVPHRLQRSGHGLVDELAQLRRREPRVHLLGFVPDADVAGVFHAADLLLLPYTDAIAASGPLSLAATYDLPALLSRSFAASHPDAPGLFELHAGAIANVVSRFFDDQGLRAAAHQFIRDLAVRNSWPRVALRMHQLYDSLVPGDVTCV